jgi:hypothetical protein
MEELEDVVLVAVAMGGESTHHKLAIKAKSTNSSGPQPEVKAYRDWWTVAGLVFERCAGLMRASIKA